MMQIVHVSCEIAPWAKTGGLGDMVGSLGPAIAGLGHRVANILPRHGHIPLSGLTAVTTLSPIHLGPHTFHPTVWQGMHTDVIPNYFIDIPGSFDRAAIYGEHGIEYPDNAIRFLAFSLAAREFLRTRQIACDILHVHDWHAALVPLYLRTKAAGEPAMQAMRTVLTIHNLAYQGAYPAAIFPLMDLEPRYFSPAYLEFYGQLNFLKGGIVAADAVTTVSPTYAAEILTPAFGCGLDGVLRDRRDRFSGILNGIDTTEWDPRQDPLLAARYPPENLAGKTACKRAIQAEVGLPQEPTAPIFSLIARLVDQKGIDLLVGALQNGMPRRRWQWIFLGDGDPALEEAVRQLAKRYPRQIVARIGYDQALAHRIEAGADFFCMPSRYEPCGYNQMYSQRYGTIPIVRATGGLRDTVIDCAADPMHGTGIVFEPATVSAIEDALAQALTLYCDPERFDRARVNGMTRDFSWNDSAQRYIALYEHLRGQ
ncbi:MAG: glycogen synthase GlgA [Deltaproteobacteria bacterium]|nr:glycogen synthase GlgA [Deltaproteobacteria bacterium]